MFVIKFDKPFFTPPPHTPPPLPLTPPPYTSYPLQSRRIRYTINLNLIISIKFIKHCIKFSINIEWYVMIVNGSEKYISILLLYTYSEFEKILVSFNIYMFIINRNTKNTCCPLPEPYLTSWECSLTFILAFNNLTTDPQET